MKEWLELAVEELGIPDDVARFMWETDEFVIASGRVVLLAAADAPSATIRRAASDEPNPLRWQTEMMCR